MIAKVQPGANPIDICREGDKLIEEKVGKIFNKKVCVCVCWCVLVCVCVCVCVCVLVCMLVSSSIHYCWCAMLVRSPSRRCFS